jgi:hypothetical protein
MTAVLGLSLLCLAVLWFAAIMSVLRRPKPPRWTRIELTAELMIVAILAVGVFGVGFLFDFAATGGLQRLTLVEDALLLAVAAGAVLLGWRLFARPNPTDIGGP